MSIITVQIGQCGNQLGWELFNSIAQESLTDGRSNFKTKEAHLLNERFFHVCDDANKIVAKAILVDTEPKVIQELNLKTEKNTWCYNKDNIYLQQQGASNNWAYGYNKHGNTAKDVVLDLFQKEIERCDWVSGFLPIMSLAGGTGSGLGAFLTEVLQDNYPKSIIFSQVVHPFNKGEVTVQSYNTILSLSHLQNSSDGIVLYKNDDLHKVCTQRMSIKNVSLQHLNKIIVQSLAGLLFPSYNNLGVTTNIGDLMAQCVSHSQYKLLDLISVPQESVDSLSFSSYSWQGLLKSLQRMLFYGSSIDEASTPTEMKENRNSQSFLSNLLVLRGSDAHSADSSVFQHSISYSSWVPTNHRFDTWTHSRPLLGHDKTATLASNGQFILSTIQHSLNKAWNMFAAKAYLHHYRRYSLTNEDFVEAFARVEQIVADYKSLH
ncbi:tubulin delta chain-like [Centruroides vittatus]|uniref:tubulin delta chain-like n=1 Tax=Centruroides vittatus TaxID=120091 RepID=UPI00350FC575